MGTKSDHLQPRAVLFDYFGTLTSAVRRGPAHRAMAVDLGVDPDEWIEILDRTFYQRATGALGEPLEVLRDLARSLGGNPRYWTLYSVYARRVATVGADGPLRPESVDVLTALRARGLRTAVVSDCWYELPRLLPWLPVHPLLDTKVFSVELGRRKPDPAMYLTACAALDVSPEECLYVGDGGSTELTGAAALGMSTLRLAAPDLRGHLTFGRDVLWNGTEIGSLPEILDVLTRTLEPAH
jgi:putative hydrolase of the HAD superfamily